MCVTGPKVQPLTKSRLYQIRKKITKNFGDKSCTKYSSQKTYNDKLTDNIGENHRKPSKKVVQIFVSKEMCTDLSVTELFSQMECLKN